MASGLYIYAAGFDEIYFRCQIFSVGTVSSIVTLLSDFGTRDHYVAAMKGVILTRLPEAVFVDISHDVLPRDIATAAYLLAGCRRDFPAGTVHLAVVDPGVGSERLPMALAAAGQFFVGPDNGVFTHILRETEKWSARRIAAEDLMRVPVSATFQGRDIFAPTAAALASGMPFDEVGPPIEKPVELDLPEVIVAEREVRGAIIHVDRFGNLITNIRAGHLAAAGLKPEIMAATIAGESVKDFADYYAAGPHGKPFLLFGSGGYLELAVRGGSAADTLDAERGNAIQIRWNG